MPSKVTTSQGQAWDQIARAKYGHETQMGVILPANSDEADVLLHAGDAAVLVPDVAPKAIKALPPWERL